jgi:hypothetical protein
MLRSLREVQADDSVVGFYQATSLGAFFNQNLVEIQAIHQDKLRHGGVVIVHGTAPAAFSRNTTLIRNARFIFNCSRKCILPSIPPYTVILRRLQKIQLQYIQVHPILRAVGQAIC